MKDYIRRSIMQQFSSSVLPIQQYFIDKKDTLFHTLNVRKPELSPSAVWTLCSRNNSHVLPDILPQLFGSQPVASSLIICLCVCVYIYVYMYVYIYIYIYRFF